MVEARDYVASGRASGYAGAPVKVRLNMSCESMRLTSRLAQIMAWLLVQKAVHADEMTRDEAAAMDNRLGGHKVCRDHDEAVVATMPPDLQSLLERSYRLFVRVARLDELVGGEATAH